MSSNTLVLRRSGCASAQDTTGAQAATIRPRQVEHDPAAVGREVEREIRPLPDFHDDVPLLGERPLAGAEHTHGDARRE
jgi:hypothetical protein